MEFTGIDLTPAGIEAATKSVQAEAELPPPLADYIPLETADPNAFKRIRFDGQGSAAELPFADDEFDLVYTVLAVEQMERIRDSRLGRDRPGQRRPCADAGAVPRRQPPRRLRRLYALSRNYFRGSIEGLDEIRAGAVVGDRTISPQEAFLGSPLVLARKVKRRS